MMVMTAKVDLKKIMLGLAAVAVLVLALIFLLGRGDGTAQTSAPAPSGNEGRIAFLKGFGWEVTPSPVESGRSRIPSETTQVFDRYNALQKSQGYDLSQLAGKNVMRYVYQIQNYPGASGPVYATLLVYKNQIVGGDITDTSPQGRIHGFKMPEPTPTAPTAPTAPTMPTTMPATTPQTSEPAPSI